MPVGIKNVNVIPFGKMTKNAHQIMVQSMTIYERFLDALTKAVLDAGNINQLAEKVGMQYSTLHRWVNRKRIPDLESIEPLLPFLGDWCSVKTINADEFVQQENEKLKKEIARLERELIKKDGAIEALHSQLDRAIAHQPPFSPRHSD